MCVYYAIVEQEGDSAYGVSFPDFPTVFSAADKKSDIIVNAIEALQSLGGGRAAARPLAAPRNARPKGREVGTHEWRLPDPRAA